MISPVDASTANSICETLTYDPDVLGVATGISLDLWHTWQGDLSIHIVACDERLVVMQRPGIIGSCAGGCPCGINDDIGSPGLVVPLSLVMLEAPILKMALLLAVVPMELRRMMHVVLARLLLLQIWLRLALQVRSPWKFASRTTPTMTQVWWVISPSSHPSQLFAVVRIPKTLIMIH